jgi:hypothetical protein
MPAFATPAPITATVEVAGAQVRVTASDRTDTVVQVEPLDAASRTDAAYFDVNSERGSVRNSVAASENPVASVAPLTVLARTRHGDIIIARAAS